MSQSEAQKQHRLVEVLAAISLATDLGMGQPLDKGLRTALLAVSLADRLDLSETDRSDTFYIALLIHLGCSATALEYEHLTGGDDIGLRVGLISVISAPPEEIPMLVGRQLMAVAPPERTEELMGQLMAHPDAGHHLLRAQCEAGVLLARGLGLPGAICRGLGKVYERWDGGGDPAGLGGEAIDLPVRVVQVAHDAEVIHRLDGLEACVGEVRRRAAAGGFDPVIAQAFCSDAGDLFADVPTEDLWQAASGAEPSPRHVDSEQLDEMVIAFGQFADLKSPYLLGHSAGVATLARNAALASGSDEAEARTLARAAHLHDIGRIGVVNGVWDKRGRLSEVEQERVRLHPYYTERVLMRSKVLAPYCGIAAAHHERMDGSGYHQHLDRTRLSSATRILAAADAFDAMTHDRPHRPAMSARDAGVTLRSEAADGRLDPRAVSAVMEGAGQRSGGKRAAWPAGLSDREVEVLRLVCTGLTAADVAAQLHLSPKTVGRHVENIYGKTGVSTRASAALFAVQQGILP
jgi:HD-GYP domain-containing protein (c-di-GMP phosphodiesterase class II)/DNA-binding CsgD family transcriptional regulator